MRIAFISRFFWPLKGGMQLHAFNLGQELQKRGHSFVAMTRFVENNCSGEDFFRKTEPARVFDNEGIETHVLSLSATDRALLWPVHRLRYRASTVHLAQRMADQVFIPRFRKLLQGYDVIHYGGIGIELLGMSALKVARENGQTFVVQPSIHFGHWGGDAYDFHFYRQVDRMQVHTETEKRYLVEEGNVPAEKIDNVANGIYDVPRRDASHLRAELGVEGPLILYIGRKSPDKGYFLVREAMQQVAESHPDARLLAIGARDTQINYDDLPRQDNVIEMDFVSEEARVDAFNACDLLCVPSEGESFGLIYVEAARVKKPVIARRLEILEELIGRYDSGILIGQRQPDKTVQTNPEEIARAIRQLLDSPAERQRLGENGYEAAAQFLWPQTVEKFIRSYEAALSTQPAHVV